MLEGCPYAAYMLEEAYGKGWRSDICTTKDVRYGYK